MGVISFMGIFSYATYILVLVLLILTIIQIIVLIIPIILIIRIINPIIITNRIFPQIKHIPILQTHPILKPIKLENKNIRKFNLRFIQDQLNLILLLKALSLTT